jgi:hypothetical protein
LPSTSTGFARLGVTNGRPVVVGDCADELVVEFGEVVDMVELAEMVLYPASCVVDACVEDT